VGTAYNETSVSNDSKSDPVEINYTGSLSRLWYTSDDCSGTSTSMDGYIMNQCFTNDDLTSSESISYCKIVNRNGDIEYGAHLHSTDALCSTYEDDYYSGITQDACERPFGKSGSYKWICSSSETPWADYPEYNGFTGYHFPNGEDLSGITSPFTDCEGPIGRFTSVQSPCDNCVEVDQNVYTLGIC
jgi:hypothetical protein